MNKNIADEVGYGSEATMTTQPKHTPEPWSFIDNSNPPCRSFKIISVDNRMVANHLSYDDHYRFKYAEPLPEHVSGNGERIVSCVNALAGIENPAEFVAAAKGLFEALRIQNCKMESDGDGYCICPAYDSRRDIGHSTACEMAQKAIARAEKIFGGLK